MILKNLEKEKLIHPPKWMCDNTQYLCRMGSVMYGLNTDTSDEDLYGWCIPPKTLVFPHLAGEIPGFGKQIQRFEQWQQHHIKFKEKEYDFQVFSIVKFFQLCLENNPNVIEALYCPIKHILHSTEVSKLVRDNRHLFLSKGVKHKLVGYAYSQLHKMKTKTPEEGSNRYEDVQTHGFDRKYAYHLVRLVFQCQFILENCDLQFERPDVQYLKAIRAGEVSEDDILSLFQEKEKTLEKLYVDSKLQYQPDEAKIKQLLLQVLEIHYQSVDVIIPDRYEKAISEIEDIITKLRKTNI